jgi:hypothetical protein
MKTNVWRLTGAVLVLAAAPSAFATYDSIQHNLINGVVDTSWDGVNGIFTLDAPSDEITLNDPGVLPGTISNGYVHMATYINDIINPQRARFQGGTFAVTFDYDADGPGPGQPVSYELSGGNNYLEFWVDFTSVDLSTIVGEGTWWATTKNLPGSGQWPDGGGLSSIGLLTIAFGMDLSNWQWGMNIDQTGTEYMESMYTLWPDDRALPEPGSLILLALGAVGLVVARRGR